MCVSARFHVTVSDKNKNSLRHWGIVSANWWYTAMCAASACSMYVSLCYVRGTVSALLRLIFAYGRVSASTYSYARVCVCVCTNVVMRFRVARLLQILHTSMKPLAAAAAPPAPAPAPSRFFADSCLENKRPQGEILTAV